MDFVFDFLDIIFNGVLLGISYTASSYSVQIILFVIILGIVFYMVRCHK